MKLMWAVNAFINRQIDITMSSPSLTAWLPHINGAAVFM
jgi:hypothetical protein